MAKKRKKKPVRRWWKAIALLLLILAGGAALALYAVDREVVATLQGRSEKTVSALLSDSFILRRGERVRTGILQHELLARRYRAVSGDPQAVGEFSIRGPEFLVYLRQFRAADGTVRAAQLVRLLPERGEIFSDQDQSLPSCAIEPQIVAPLGGENRRAATSASLAEIPTSVQNAVLAIEDQRFYSHAGIDPLGIARAMVENLLALRIVQGGSTITQQLAKNLLFTPERTFGRKIMEALAAFSLEYRLSKDQILEYYLNEVYLGQEGAIAIHGFGAAAHSYFGKQIQDLSLAESALLAGLIQAPSAYAPRRYPERAKLRRDLVLTAMQNAGLISEQERLAASREPIAVLQPSYRNRVAPHFTAAIRSELAERLNLDTAILSGVSVYTGLAPEHQRCAEEATEAGLAEIEKQHPKLAKRRPRLEIGLVALEPFSGKVRAWVGGRNFSRNQFDHVLQAERQIGSTIKPFLYLTALDSTLNSYKIATATTTLLDEPIEIKVPGSKAWRPENYDETFRGPVSLREALENSLNMPAIYTAQKFGVDALARTVESFHLAEHPPAVPALALGAIDTTLLKLTAAFGALANGGIYVEPRLYVSVLDANGDALATGTIEERVVAAPAPTFVLTNILRGVINHGTGKSIRALGFQGDAAGKTGTSNESRDAWFVGFTPDLVTGIWIGFDDNHETGLTGGGAAAPIWGRFMKCLAPFREELEFLPPRDVVALTIDPKTGLRVTSECPSDDTIQEYFVRGTEPLTRCQLRHPGEKDREPNERPHLREPEPRPIGDDRPWWERIL